ncbi:unnamed protein product [Ectocarpus sp. 8 AP-2014]
MTMSIPPVVRCRRPSNNEEHCYSSSSPANLGQEAIEHRSQRNSHLSLLQLPIQQRRLLSGLPWYGSRASPYDVRASRPFPRVLGTAAKGGAVRERKAVQQRRGDGKESEKIEPE